jgi:hypothetical protein
MPPPIPSAPVLGYSFTANSTNNPTSQQPGVQLDAEFNRSNGAITDLIDAVSVSLNADGSLKSSAVQAAYAAGSGGSGNIINIFNAPSAASALLAQAWAEYLPGELPADTLAGTGITGDHFSARYWANHADVQVSDTQNQIATFTALLAASTNSALVGAPLFLSTGTYAAQSLVVNAGVIYRAKATVNPGPFDVSQWDQVTGTTPPLPLTGGTLTGPLTLAANPATALQPATKQYTDAADALALPKAGGTMTGALTLAANPATALQPATKQYTDAADALALPKTGGTMTGAITLAADPVTALQPATRQYVDATTLRNTGRNRLDNGWMEVQQRGAGTFAGNGYGPDRWLVSAPTGPITFGVLSSSAFGTRFYLSASCALLTNGAMNIAQRIPSVDAFDLVGQTVTVSFWAAASTTAGSFSVAVNLAYPLTTADNFGNVATAGNQSITVTATPTRVQATFPNLPAAVANGLQLAVIITQLTANGTATLNISGVQMEVGSTATALERRPFQQELARCMRFYQQSQVFLAGYAVASVAVTQTLPLGIPMRGAPTITLGTNSSNNVNTLTSGILQGGVYVQGVVVASGGYALNVLFTLSSDL